MNVIDNINMLMLLMSYVIKRAGTFTIEEKTKLLEFISFVAQNPDVSSKEILTTYTQRLT